MAASRGGYSRAMQHLNGNEGYRCNTGPQSTIRKHMLVRIMESFRMDRTARAQVLLA